MLWQSPGSEEDTEATQSGLTPPSRVPTFSSFTWQIPIVHLKLARVCDTGCRWLIGQTEGEGRTCEPPHSYSVPLPNRGSRRPASVDPLCPLSHICANCVLLLLQGAGQGHLPHPLGSRMETDGR